MAGCSCSVLPVLCWVLFQMAQARRLEERPAGWGGGLIRPTLPPHPPTDDNLLAKATRDQIITLDNTILEISEGLHEGDIVLTDEQKLLLQERKATNPALYWPKDSSGTVTVGYRLGDTIINKTLVMVAITHWETNTCVRFKEVKPTVGYAHLNFVNSEYCASYVGRSSSMTTGQTIWLHPKCLSRVGPAVHEIGHALGFNHEQSRSDRDAFVRVIWNNIEAGKGHNFNKEVTYNYGVPYDYSSVMHYGPYSFTANGLNTLLALNPIAQPLMGNRIGLSFADKRMANTMYGCIGKWLAKCSLSIDPCKNMGYTGPNCSCVCPEGTSGSLCEVLLDSYTDALIKSNTPYSETITLPGTVSTPGYPTPIQTRTKFVKVIVAPECFKVKITFNDFEMYGRYTDGFCSIDALLIRTQDALATGIPYCGKEIAPGTVFISGNNTIVLDYFNSDYASGNESSLYRGFNATVEHIPTNGCNVSTPPTTTKIPTTKPTTTKPTTTKPTTTKPTTTKPTTTKPTTTKPTTTKPTTTKPTTTKPTTTKPTTTKPTTTKPTTTKPTTTKPTTTKPTTTKPTTTKLTTTKPTTTKPTTTKPTTTKPTTTKLTTTKPTTTKPTTTKPTTTKPTTTKPTTTKPTTTKPTSTKPTTTKPTTTKPATTKLTTTTPTTPTPTTTTPTTTTPTTTTPTTTTPITTTPTTTTPTTTTPTTTTPTSTTPTTTTPTTEAETTETEATATETTTTPTTTAPTTTTPSTATTATATPTTTTPTTTTPTTTTPTTTTPTTTIPTTETETFETGTTTTPITTTPTATAPTSTTPTTIPPTTTTLTTTALPTTTPATATETTITPTTTAPTTTTPTTTTTTIATPTTTAPTTTAPTTTTPTTETETTEIETTTTLTTTTPTTTTPTTTTPTVKRLGPPAVTFINSGDIPLTIFTSSSFLCTLSDTSTAGSYKLTGDSCSVNLRTSEPRYLKVTATSTLATAGEIIHINSVFGLATSITSEDTGQSFVLPSSTTSFLFTPIAETLGNIFELGIQVQNSDCHQIIKVDAGATGTLTKTNYAANTVCEWWIQAPSGKEIQLAFSAFNVGMLGCGGDFLGIDTSGDSSSNTTSAKYCATTSPKTVTSSGGQMNVLLNGIQGGYPGFTATYIVV